MIKKQILLSPFLSICNLFDGSNECDGDNIAIIVLKPIRPRTTQYNKIESYPGSLRLLPLFLSVYYDSGFLPDIILSILCKHHRGTRLNAIKRPIFLLKRLANFPPCFRGCSEGFDSLRLFLYKYLNTIKPNITVMRSDFSLNN